MKKLAGLVVVCVFVFLVGCGGSAGSGDPSPNPDPVPSSNLDADQQGEATLMMRAVVGSLSQVDESFGGNVMVPKGLTYKVPHGCLGGGSLDIGIDSIQYSNCTIVIGGATIVMDGSISITQTGNLTTVVYDIAYSYTLGALNVDFTMTGSVSWNDTTITFNNLQGDFNGFIYSMNGHITDNGDGTLDGVVVFACTNGSATCVFDNFNPDTATDADYAHACGF